MTVREKLMTAQEFAALPDDGRRYDLVKGELVEVGRPKPLHSILQARITRFVDAYVDQNELGLVTTEGGYILSHNPDTVRGPGVAFLSKARLAHPDLTEYIPMAPDLVVEIVSPGDTAAEILDKVDEYFLAGARLIWVVYPDKRLVYAYQGPQSVQIIGMDGVLNGGDVLPGFKLPLHAVFKGIA